VTAPAPLTSLGNCTAGRLQRHATSTTAWGPITGDGLRAPAGSFIGHQAGVPRCKPCAEGSRGSTTNNNTTTTCTVCAAGTTTTGEGQTSCNANCPAIPNRVAGTAGWLAPSWTDNVVDNLCTPICQAGFFESWRTCPRCPVFNNSWGNWAGNTPNPHNATSTQGARSAEECRVLSTQDFNDSIGTWRFQSNRNFACPSGRWYDPGSDSCINNWGNW
jgi:hypothetical protein